MCQIVCGIFCSTYVEDVNFKREQNRICMQNYRRNVMSDEQKLRYKELNRKTAAANRLKKKECETVVKERNRLRQQKCRLLKTIPASPSKYQKVVHCVLKAAEKSANKMMIFGTL